MTKIVTISILVACLYVLYVPNITLHGQEPETNQEIK
jgi:hypothetical protein